MPRSTLLLIVLAFAFGLWLGFNPEAHAKTEQTWQEIKAAFTEFVEKASTETSEPVSIPNTGEDSKPNETWDQVSAVFRNVWESVKTLWKDFMKKLPETNA